MYLAIAPVIVLLVATLLAVGVGRRRYWALYVLNGLWFCGLVVAAYFTVLAWMGSAHSENWAMYGVIFYVWPYTALVAVAGGLELVLLRGHDHPHARRCRLLISICMAALLVLSASTLVLA